jgi:hypothetical protein
MRTGATLGRGNARRDHPEARGIARTSPDRGRIDLAGNSAAPPMKNLLRYVCIDIYNP